MFLGKEKKSSFMVQLFAAVPFLIAEKKKCVTNLKKKKKNETKTWILMIYRLREEMLTNTKIAPFMFRWMIVDYPHPHPLFFVSVKVDPFRNTLTMLMSSKISFLQQSR